MEKDTTKEFELKYCEIHCGQMTNHIGDICQKCKLPAKETTIEGLIEKNCNSMAIAITVMLENKVFKGKYSSFDLEGIESKIEEVLKCNNNFLKSVLTTQKEEIENNIVKMKKTDLDLSPGFNVTAEYRLGEIRGWNEAIEYIISSITSNKEKI